MASDRDDMAGKALRRSGDDAGVYCLVLRLRRARSVTVGKLGRRRLEPGWYLYVGSAKRNLTARLDRHIRAEKRFRWHVDFLRAVACMEEIWVWPWDRGAECRLNARVQALDGAGIPWSAFGSSDCRCRSHMTFFRAKPRWPRGAASESGVRLSSTYPNRDDAKAPREK